MGDQLTLDLFPTTTVDGCEHSQAVADIGKGKTLCSRMGMWTNCLEVGRCVADMLEEEARN